MMKLLVLFFTGVVFWVASFFHFQDASARDITFQLPDEVSRSMENRKKMDQNIHEDVDVRLVFQNPNEHCSFRILWHEDPYVWDNQKLFFKKDIIVSAGKTSSPRFVRTAMGRKTILVRAYKMGREFKNFPLDMTFTADGKKIKKLPMVEGCYERPGEPWWYRGRQP